MLDEKLNSFDPAVRTSIFTATVSFLTTVTATPPVIWSPSPKR